MAAIANVNKITAKISCRVQRVGATSSSSGAVRKVAGPITATAQITVASVNHATNPVWDSGETGTLTINWKTDSSTGPTFVLPAIVGGPRVNVNINTGEFVSYEYNFKAFDHATADFTAASIIAGTTTTTPYSAKNSNVDWA